MIEKEVDYIFQTEKILPIEVKFSSQKSVIDLDDILNFKKKIIKNGLFIKR